jgi:hypothetical protein
MLVVANSIYLCVRRTTNYRLSLSRLTAAEDERHESMTRVPILVRNNNPCLVGWLLLKVGTHARGVVSYLCEVGPDEDAVAVVAAVDGICRFANACALCVC